MKLSEKQKEVIRLMRKHKIMVNAVIMEVPVKVSPATLFQLRQKGVLKHAVTFWHGHNPLIVDEITKLGKTIEP